MGFGGKCSLAALSAATLALAGGGGQATGGHCCVFPLADLRPVWSSDGRALASETAGGQTNVRVLDLESGKTRDALIPARSLAFSPDLSLVVGFVTVPIAAGRGGLDLDLVLYRSDGTELWRLPLGDADARPSWSPDGKRIAFVSSTAGSRLSLFTVNRDGTGLTKVVENAVSAGSWSPDNSQVAYVAHVNGRLDVFVVTADGSSGRDLSADLPGMNEGPVWSPDGTRVAFVTGALDRVIHVRRLDGVEVASAVSRLPTSGLERTPVKLSWSPDGKALVYSGSSRFAADRFRTGIYRLDVSSGDQRVLAEFGSDASYSPDGIGIAFAGPGTWEDLHACVGLGIWIVSSTGGRPRLASRNAECAHEPATIFASSRSLAFGDQSGVSGEALPGFGSTVRVIARACGRGRPAFVGIGDPVSGHWEVPTGTARVTTTYQARWGTETAEATNSVVPRVLLSNRDGVLSVRVFAARSFAHKHAILQRDGWVNVRAITLQAASKPHAPVAVSAATFRWAGPFTTQHTVRIFLPKSTVGRCYSPAASNEIPYPTP
jgi:Tol biopolymer transport system component